MSMEGLWLNSKMRLSGRQLRVNNQEMNRLIILPDAGKMIYIGKIVTELS